MIYPPSSPCAVYFILKIDPTSVLLKPGRDSENLEWIFHNNLASLVITSFVKKCNTTVKHQIFSRPIFLEFSKIYSKFISFIFLAIYIPIFRQCTFQYYKQIVGSWFLSTSHWKEINFLFNFYNFLNYKICFLQVDKNLLKITLKKF